MKLHLPALFVSLALAGCATFPQPVADPKALWCETNDPLPKLPAIAVASLSRDEKEAMVVYQDKGIAWCGWKP